MDFFLPPVQLTLDESLALAALAEHVGGNEQVPFLESASKAINKVRGQLPAVIRQELEQIEDHVAIKLAAASAPESTADVYQTVRKVISSRKVLSCSYDGLNKNSGNGFFVFKPCTLLFNQRSWYAIGHHSKHKEVRCLRLSRFTQVQPDWASTRWTKPISCLASP